MVQGGGGGLRYVLSAGMRFAVSLENGNNVAVAVTVAVFASLSQSSHMSGFGSSASELQDSSTLIDRVNFLNGSLTIWQHCREHFGVLNCS